MSVNPKITDPRAQGQRTKIRRNRKARYLLDAVVTDGQGNILDRPLLERLPCFADPIEWLMGRGDVERRFGDKEPEPNGCAGCGVAASCARVADERLQSVREVRDAYQVWERDSYLLDYLERFKIPSWGRLVDTVNNSQWADPNEERLTEARAATARAHAEKKRQRNKVAKKRSKAPRSVSAKIRKAIGEYQAAREEELLRMKGTSKPPLWVRNRSKERLILIPAVWAKRELLERANLPSSGRAVFEQLQLDGTIPPDASPSMKKRVEEMLSLTAELIDSGEWPFFDPVNETVPRGMGSGMPRDTVWQVLDPEFETA